MTDLSRKTPCNQRPAGSSREVLAAMYAGLAAREGDEKARQGLMRHRLHHCLAASTCGRLCPRLVKDPGTAGVWCVDLAVGTKTLLYPALESLAFECPEKRF